MLFALLYGGEHAAQTYFYYAEIIDLVYLYLCIQLSRALQYRAQLVGRYGVYTAAEGDELNEIDIFVAGGKFRRPVQSGMIGPLVEHVHFYIIALFKDAVLGENRHAELSEQFIYAVIYFVIEMLRSASQDYSLLALPFGFGNDSFALCPDIAMITFQPCKTFVQSCRYLLFGHTIFFEA